MNCKICGVKAQSEYCFKHKKKKPLSSGKGFSSKKSVFKHKEISKEPDKMKNFFLDIWKIKPHICENCNVYLGKEAKSYMFDHLLEKSKYPELAFEKENIMIVCLKCHDEKTRGFYSDIVKDKINHLTNKFLCKR